jgi:hypothetical protein
MPGFEALGQMMSHLPSWHLDHGWGLPQPSTLNFALRGRLSNVITACITLDRLLGKAWAGWSGWRSLVKLLPPVLVGVHNIKSVRHLCLGLDEHLKHISKDATLGDGQAIARLALGWIVGTKTFCIGWIDVRHEDSRDVEGILFEIIERMNGIQKGAVIDLSAKLNGDTFLDEVALPDVV